ncbi:DUF2970 domain-containing protein [Ferrimonas aestuarii]|uniref:DUF2970 domain-containing protein n=1 Tax=Ferrimonas aestuarii TaxID=2569539 RepID=A0A4U1BFG6_9GAMM|nr:DUF2970 domain-containing protein [Ferrimonas aestuarii]TKB49138.1 DUF2970 domain-containing protein [Ferrimonas aestuarii]
MSWRNAFGSVLAALFGVQSEANRQRDFNESSPLPYIVVGVVMVTLFVISLLAIVNMVLS